MSGQQTTSRESKVADNDLASKPNDHITLLADGIQVDASRSLLSNASDYFSAMFSSGMKESKNEVIEIEVDKDLMQLLVNFSRTGEIIILEGQVERLLVASVYLQFSKVVAECCNFLKSKLKADNCLRIENLALSYFLPDLMLSCHSFALANFLDVSKTEDFLQLNPDRLREFLTSDIINVNSEDDIFEALVSWLNLNKSHTKEDEEDLVKTVRFPYCSPAVISKAVEDPHFKSAVEILRKLESGEAIRNCRPRKATAGILLAVGMSGVKHTWDEYDPVTDVWRKAGSAIASAEGVRWAIADAGLYYAGGMTDCLDDSDFMYLDFSQERWFSGPKLLQARHSHGAAWLEGALYVVGGEHANIERILSDVEKWRRDSDGWENMAPLPSPKGFFGLTVLGNKMYAVGGCDETYSAVKIVYCFDTGRNTWATCAPLNIARYELGVGVQDGVIYAVGGYSSERSERIADLERYDPRIDKWETLPKMPTPRSEPAVSSLAGEVYVVGGNSEKKRVPQLVEIYDPSAQTWRTGSSLESRMENIQIFHLPSKASFFRKDI